MDTGQHPEHLPIQTISVRVYQSDGRIMVAAPLPGLEAPDIFISVSGRTVTIRGEQRGPRQNARDLSVEEWAIGPYERVLELQQPVIASRTNATYGNGVLVLALPKAEAGQAGGETEFHLEVVNATRGAHVGHTGRDLRETTTGAHRQGMEQSALRAEGRSAVSAADTLGPGTTLSVTSAPVQDKYANEITQRSVGRADRERAERAASRQRNNEPDAVTRQSMDSFPASDPPSWIPAARP
jgi:HSP20 family molecular chaperone IbpA